jgi:subtilase family serine protease
VPAVLSDVVLGFANLDNFRPKSHLKRSSTTTDPVLAHFTSNATGIHSLIPDDFATIYNVKPLYTAGFDGNGQKLVVVGQTALVTNGSAVTDIDAFRTAAGLPARTASNFEMTLVPSTGTATVFCTTTSCDLDEASLDVEWSWGIARGATLNYVFVGNSSTSNVFDALHYAIENNLAPVISISYGNCESAIGSSSAQQFAGWAQQANAQGQTITAASGDFGAADCDTSPTLPAQGGVAVDIPAALPYVTGVGGTEFTGDADATVSGSCAAATTFWAQSCSATSGGSALSYIPETTWNDTTSAKQLDGTGGGASIFYSKPSWQSGTGVPADGARDVPDIALNASNAHDSYIFCVSEPASVSPVVGPCTSGFRDSAGQLNRAGGTSFGAPTFAGIVTILNHKTGSSQGNLNPTLYAVYASTPSAFHDITTGNNIVPCGTGTPDCPTTGTLQYGFSAGTGYDQVTGLGTPDVNALVSAWSSGNPTTADYSVFANVASISAPGGSATSTISIDGRNGFSGTVTLACSAPSTAAITCSINPSSVTLSSGTSNATATLTIKTTAASLDRHDAPLSPLFGGGAVMAGVFLFGIPAVRRRWNVVLALLMVAFLIAAMGCGGSKSGGGGGGSGTPAGNYTVSVTATSGSTTHTTNISVTVI